MRQADAHAWTEVWLEGAGWRRVDPTAAVAPETRIEVIPNCIHLDDYADVSQTAVPHTLIFTGAFTYQPNHEAMVWFLEEVFPLVRAQLSYVRLTITGNHADKPLPTLENVTWEA